MGNKAEIHTAEAHDCKEKDCTFIKNSAGRKRYFQKCPPALASTVKCIKDNMKRTIIIISILTFLIPNISIGQAEKKYSKNYIPKNLTECLIQLDSTLSDSIKQNILTYPETEFVGLSQLNLGMYLRNKWGLWWGSELSVYFNNLGINHPDDMSGIILTSYCRHLNGVPIDFIELVNSSRKNNSLEPIITINEDSLTNLSILYRPFDKFSPDYL
ncbi:MAG: hypothetical protein IPF68_20015 [Bacteroidales bacterium]|nr:hypothetical protein [Bacteroidales bacterium]